MRIVIVRREPGVALSMDVYTDNLVAELKQLRPTWEIVEIAPQPWSKNQENLWHSGTGFRKYQERFWHHPRQVKQTEGDIYHIIDHSNAHVVYWLKQKGKPIVVTCHDLVQFIYPEILVGQSRFPALSMAAWRYSVRGMTQADRVVTVSTNTAKDVEQYLGIGPNRIIPIPNGVDTEFRRLTEDQVAAFRQKHQRCSEEICLLNIGSTHQRKNIIAILKVLKGLKQQGIPARFWRSGAEFTSDQMNFIQANDLAADILDFGQCNQETLIQLYNAADLLLAPSLYEGFGLTVLEAMACGLPVITANTSSLPEVAGNAACLVDPNDIESMIAQTCHLKQDAGYREKLIAAGLQRVQHFGWQRAGASLAQVYEALLLSPMNATKFAIIH
jgi:glycosyltransferase involved in cell wall biosynthesis